MANMITKHIPNTLTSLNLFSGCLAVIAAYEGNYPLASLFIIAGAVFDFFDGMSARLLKAYSPMGKELDSLADMVTFGVAPAMIAFSLMKSLVPAGFPELLAEYLPYAAFLIAIFSALRLAKFNIDERQTSSFIGLPTPANALFWIGICMGLTTATGNVFIANIWIILALVVIFSYLLVAEIPMFSFKFKSLNWKDNQLRYIFLIIAVPLLIILGITGISAVIGLYIILSLLTGKKSVQP
ncbi:MAG: CDP-diacylglycerol--serine O-phosphatidyltransferase [Bacteroidales bacterium]